MLLRYANATKSIKYYDAKKKHFSFKFIILFELEFERH